MSYDRKTKISKQTKRDYYFLNMLSLDNFKCQKKTISLIFNFLVFKNKTGRIRGDYEMRFSKTGVFKMEGGIICFARKYFL